MRFLYTAHCVYKYAHACIYVRSYTRGYARAAWCIR